jgi:predicted PurR-regulated permease PerM
MNNRIIGLQMTFFLLAVILLLYGLIVAKAFLYPLALGILMAYLLYPIVNFFEKKGLPRIISILIPIFLAIATITFLAMFLLKHMSLFMDDLPYFRQKTIEHIITILGYIQNEFGLPVERFKDFLVSKVFDIGTRTEKIFTATTGTVFAILMQPVYVFLFLYYRTKFAYFFLKIVGRENRLITIRVLRQIAQVATHYMLGITTVVLILCVFNSMGYLLIGIRYPLLLGVISALFSFIPYFGNIIGGSIPLIFTLLTEDSRIYALRVLVFIYIVHFFENNILSPNIVGDKIRINAFVLILGLIAGALIWGIPGMLVVIPFLAMLHIILKNVPGMQPYAYLLGPRGTQRHALTLVNIKRFFSMVNTRWQKRISDNKRK